MTEHIKRKIRSKNKLYTDFVKSGKRPEDLQNTKFLN